MKQSMNLLTDPFLQLPTSNSVRVIWFTEFAGKDHLVTYGDSLSETVFATSFKLSCMREDGKSKLTQSDVNNTVSEIPQLRHIWRHEAEVTNLIPGVKVLYKVISITETGEKISSETFSLTASPIAGTPSKILLTSDHQLMPMTAANLQKVVETVGRVDAVFCAGDLVNVSDRASEWFDDSRGNSFFPCLQGKASYQLMKNGVSTTYTGGEIIQHAPLFTAIGNHEVMGRFSVEKSLNEQFEDAVPNEFSRPGFNTNSYEEIFSLPQSETGGKKYYAITFGDIRLIVLYIASVWRNPSLKDDIKGRYKEASQDLPHPENWGYGQHILEAIAPGSLQYTWLENELTSPEFKQAKYKIAMLHHPPHTLGDNIVPAFTDPVAVRETDFEGNLTAIRYEYPKHADYIIRDLMPLLEAAGVQMVYFGHSHLWNRFTSANNVHYLESSNVGNSYGAAWGNRQRSIPTGYQEEYTAMGDPNGLEPIVPNIDPLLDTDGNPLPYIASNDLTVFSVLDTATGGVSSYRFDTRTPEIAVIKFDEFLLKSS
jgi:hypothetical protein